MVEPRRDPDRWSGAVCERGHVESGAIERLDQEVAPFCDECGANVLTACPSCKGQILGFYINSYNIRFEPPQFCRWCASPFPWASRESLVHHLENQLQREPGLAEGDRRKLLDQIAVLRESPADAGVERRQAVALTAIKKLAPKAWDVGAPIIQNLLTSTIRQHMGLPPTG